MTRDPGHRAHRRMEHVQRIGAARDPDGPLLDIDGRTMARQLGAVLLAGGLLAFVWLLLPHDAEPNAWGVGACATLAVGLGVGLARGAADEWPTRAFAIALFLATGLIAVAACFSGSRAS